MNKDKDFQRYFTYDADTDTYVSTQGDHEVIFYQVGDSYLVTKYIYEKGEKVYIGNDFDLAIFEAVKAVESVIVAQ